MMDFPFRAGSKVHFGPEDVRNYFLETAAQYALEQFEALGEAPGNAPATKQRRTRTPVTIKSDVKPKIVDDVADPWE